MRQLTEAERVVMANAKLDVADEVMSANGLQGLDLAFKYGFIAGLDHAQAKIEALETLVSSLTAFIEGQLTRDELDEILERRVK